MNKELALNTRKNRNSNNLADDYDDLPIFDVYDEVLEVSEDREASSRASLPALYKSNKLGSIHYEGTQIESQRSRKASRNMERTSFKQ